MDIQNSILTIVLPCYNPASHWSTHIIHSYKELEHVLGFSPKLIVVNDGSTQVVDNRDIELLKTEISNVCYVSYAPNKGKGAAVRHGVSLATTAYVIYTDIDFPYTNESIYQIYKQLLDGDDIVVGVKDAHYYEKVPWVRKWISKFLRKMIGLFLRMPITDTQCGLKGMNVKGVEVYKSTTIDRYLCDLEFVYKAFKSKNKLQIKAIKVRLKEGVVFRKMNRKILLQEGLNFIKILCK